MTTKKLAKLVEQTDACCLCNLHRSTSLNSYEFALEMLHTTEPMMLHSSSQPNAVLLQNKHDTTNHVLEDQ